MSEEGQRLRYMRIVVFFDLPVETAFDRKNYRKFRRYLLKNGFLMLQESVYAKLAINENACEWIVNDLRKNRPPAGLVEALRITEKQFANMLFITGEEAESEYIDSKDELIIL